MVTFTINIPQMLAYIPYMDPMGKLMTSETLACAQDASCCLQRCSAHHGVPRRGGGERYGAAAVEASLRWKRGGPSKNGDFTHEDGDLTRTNGDFRLGNV